MSGIHPPVVGTWYVNGAGKLVLVKMLSYAGKLPQRVMIESQEGATRMVPMADWGRLNLQIHAWVPAQHRSVFRSTHPN
jgi:hypothetical protein